MNDQKILDKTLETMTEGLNKMVILNIGVKSSCFLINYEK